MTAINVAEKKHAVLGASGAHRWATCAGSVVLCEGRKDSAGYHAKWGTAGHELAAVMLEPFNGLTMDSTMITDIEALNAESYLGRIFHVEGEDFEVDQDMATCVNGYIAHVVSLLDIGDILFVEQELPIEHITGEKGATGTGDIVIIKPAAHQIISLDLKTGKGVQVDAENNPQCIMYADGAIEAFDPIYGPFEGWSVRSVIVQPRIEHYDFEVVGWYEHKARIGGLQFAAERVRDAHAKYPRSSMEHKNTSGPSLDWSALWLNPDPKACKFCNAKAICPALRGAVSEGMSKTAAAEPDNFPDMVEFAHAAVDSVPLSNDKALSEALRVAPLAEMWLAAIREEGFKRLMDGVDLEGFKLVHGKRGNRAWGNKAEAEEIMKAARLKSDEMYAKSLIGVKPAETLLQKSKPKVWAKLAGLITQSEGSPHMAPEDDPRARYKPAVAAAEDFPELDAGEDVDPFS